MAIYAEKDREGRPTGTWRVEVTRDGVRTRERHPDHRAAKAAEARLKAGGPRVEKARGITLGAGLALASSVLWKGKASWATAWPRLERMVGHLGPDRLLDAVDTALVDRMILWLLRGEKGRKAVDEATVNRYLSHLHVFLTWAEERGHRTVPVASIAFDWRDEDEGRIRWITEDEQAQLRRLLPPAIWRLVLVAIETGCRRGELLSATLDQVSGSRLHLWDTKTGEPRTVHMEAHVAQLLRQAIAEGMPSPSELVYQWDKARAAMGLSGDDGFTFHVCRHTCATRLVDAGVGLVVIKEFLGHRSIKTTQRYAHVRSEALEDALARRRAHQGGHVALAA